MENNKCSTCRYWIQPAPCDETQQKLRGCALWNNYKHLGHPPNRPGPCEACGRGEELDFEDDLLRYGPNECYEGWVGKRRLINYSIITPATTVCTFFKAKDKKEGVA